MLDEDDFSRGGLPRPPRLLSSVMTPGCGVLQGPLHSCPVPRPLQATLRGLRALRRPPFSARPLPGLPPASTHGQMLGGLGRSRRATLRGQRSTSAGRAFHCLDSLSIARHAERPPADDVDRRRATAGVSPHFPQGFRRHRLALACGQCRSCPIQPRSTRHMHDGFSRAGLYRHAPLPCLVPGQDQAVA